jgi:hypothetical protein
VFCGYRAFVLVATSACAGHRSGLRRECGAVVYAPRLTTASRLLAGSAAVRSRPGRSAVSPEDIRKPSFYG